MNLCDKESVAFLPTNSANAHSIGTENELSPTLVKGCGESGNKPSVAIAALCSQMRYIVRRLTPIECERLMGLPDGYTIPAGLRRYIGPTGFSLSLVSEFQRIFDTFGAIMTDNAHTKPPKPKSAAFVRSWLAKISDPATCPDSPRYKACGNGWATNQPRWILTRLLAADGIDPFCPAREDLSSRPQQKNKENNT